MQNHRYNLGVIGNCAFMAHININTNIDWMCWPQFDSSFIFGKLISDEKGGDFSILPQTEFTSSQYYIENTNILCTYVECKEGAYKVTDFAPRFIDCERPYKPLMLIRKIEPLRGQLSIKITCKPKGDYGNMTPVENIGSDFISYDGLTGNVRLSTNVPLAYILNDNYFTLHETKYLVLTYGAPLEGPIESTSEKFLFKTMEYWHLWVKSTSIGNLYQTEVIRSALTLKIHQYEDTGAIIASATTSLPEFDQSGRNWDYRFCWLRDTYYILQAFNNVGHFEELEKYFDFITNVSIKEKERFQPLYPITGKGTPEEKILPLEGYQNNIPVRIGNEAYTHIQNDVYGQVLVSLLSLYIDKRYTIAERSSSHRMIFNILNKIDDTMNEPDAGLWEFRNFAQKHCYTFLFHWAGSNSALKIAKALKDEKMAAFAEELRDKAAANIEACYDEKRGVYTNAIGSSDLDASTLQLILMNYLDPNSDRAKTHLEQIEKELKTAEGLVFRYKHQDDFGKPKSTFLICAFWYVEALACVGRIEDAMKEFENLMKYSNHLGLLSEDVDAITGCQWGNFPQTYSHVGLMNAAYRIAKKADRPNFL